MVSAKVLRIKGDNVTQIDEISLLLQEFLNIVAPADLRQLLTKANQKPSIVKKALKFM